MGRGVDGIEAREGIEPHITGNSSPWRCTLPCFVTSMNELRFLGDKDLLKRTSEIAGRERAASVELLLHLSEVDRRQLFLEIGYSSLYDYVIQELKYSEGATYRRLQAMRLIRDIPEA